MRSFRTMQIEERSAGDVTVLDLKGKMTLGEGDELLKDKINSLVQQGRRKVVLNLDGRPLHRQRGPRRDRAARYTTVSRQGGSLKLLNLTKRITDLLSITKLLTVFETYDSEADAVRSFSVREGLTAEFDVAPEQGHAAARIDRSGLLLVSLRPEQWTKNLLVLAGVVFGGRLLEPPAVAIALAAFAIFCALSGAVYLFNDVADREADQNHPLKRERPIASGQVVDDIGRRQPAWCWAPPAWRRRSQ